MENLDTGTAPVETQAATEGLQTSAPVETTAPTQSAQDAPKVTIDDTLQRVYEKHYPPRENNGKFAAKEQPAVEQPQAAPAEQVTDQSKETPLETAPAPSIEAPNSWSAEMKAKFGTLPPDVRDYVAKRESEVHKAITQLGERARAFEPLAQTVAKHDSFVQRFGLSREQAVDNLFVAAQNLQNDPAGFIRHIAATHGVDLTRLASEAPQQAAIDPRVNQLQAQLAQVQQLLTSQQRSQEETRQKSVESEIEAFAKDKPYWADLEAEMIYDIQAIRAAEPDLSIRQVLEKAYDRASNANPTVRQRIFTDQRKADAEKAAKDAEKKAAEARKASAINQRSNAGASPATPRTIEGTMRAVAEKYYGANSF